MAYFSDFGAHCSTPYCGEKDFLPFKCDACNQVFCLEHRSYKAHDCKSANLKDVQVIVCPICHKGIRMTAADDANQVWDTHARTDCAPSPAAQGPPKCPVKGCKERLAEVSSIICPSCRHRVCLKHRYEDSHPCSEWKNRRNSKGEAPLVGGKWRCPRCTLINGENDKVCKACTFRLKRNGSKKCIVQ